jgi:MFS family permease
VCALLIATVPVVHAERAERAARGRYRTELREGVAFLSGEPLLRAIVGVIAATNLLDAAMFSVLLPVWARHTGRGADVVGLLAAAFSVTALAGSLLAAAAGHRIPRRAAFVVGYLVVGAPRFLVLGLGAPLAAVVAVHLVAGLGAGALNPIVHAITLERIPEAMLGRVTSLIDALAWSGIPVGGLVAGGLLALTGLPAAFALCGGAYFVATMLPALRPAFRAMDQPGSNSTLAACNTATRNTAIALPKRAPPMP